MKLGIVMDPIQRIHVAKDTSLALLLEAQYRGYAIDYMEPQDIWLKNSTVYGRTRRLSVRDDTHDWYQLDKPIVKPLSDLDLLLMRKDPPFNMAYVYLTYLLEQAESAGVRVINRPASLRNANEKLFTAWFSQCCPHTLVSSSIEELHAFIKAEKKVVIKPLGAMGGASVFVIQVDDLNTNVILETMTQYQTQLVMAQTFIDKINAGDKRILLINGKPVPYALARIPKCGDFRGNIASGASIEGRELSDRDRWICQQVAPTLVAKGLFFVGLDVIGDYLTEINVTSPTCVRELDTLFGLNIAADFFDAVNINDTF